MTSQKMLRDSNVSVPSDEMRNYELEIEREGVNPLPFEAAIQDDCDQ